MAPEHELALPKPGDLVAMVAYRDAKPSAWMDFYALRFAQQNGHRFAYWTGEHMARRLAVAERRAVQAQTDRAHALSWVDQHFSFNPIDRDSTLAGAPAPPSIQGVMIEPFDPYRAWNQKRQSEHEHAKQIMEALRTYAMTHQVHL